jgi:putative restriction endonuclease
MPQLPKPELIERVRDAVQQSDWHVLFEPALTEHPFRLRVFDKERRLSLLVYIWTITHGGGRRRPQREYRIQLTGVSPPLKISRDYVTLLLGWYEELQVFAGFDVTKHTTFSTRSPSIQIHLDTLERAAEQGFGLQTKGNDEIAVAFRSDLLMEYVVNQAGLHEFGVYQAELPILETAALGQEIPKEELGKIASESRREVVRTVSVKQRASDFRRRVLRAYAHQCAICTLQLELAEAAHIIPVSAPSSNDLTCNGLALCPLHHKAYDRTLIAVDEHYKVLINRQAFKRLQDVQLGGGAKKFIAGLRDTIVLPQRVADYPNPDYLHEGMKLRGWT